jgi:two-component system, chemotaxis family, CheB/CheR fusion protein
MKKPVPARKSKKAVNRAADPVVEPQLSVSPSEQASFPIVGVGASAGALEAYTQLLKALPANPGMAFVLIPHLDPTHESALTGLLSHATKMPVVQVSDGMAVRPNHVYVLPPNCEITITEGLLRLKRRETGRTPHMVVDIFLRSLAEDQGPNAVGVILSGTASDGTLGVMAIKGEGGITFAQDSASARYDGMPSSAVASGCIDFVLPPVRIAEELMRLRSHAYVTQPKGIDVEKLGGERQTQLDRVFRLLREASNVDFTEYKPGTIRRRILRRMALKQFNELGDYVRYLSQHRDEVQALYQDLLINVTSFFRNPEAFDALKEVVYPELLKDRERSATIRIWVPGCSSGEEAYSHAICLVEYLTEARLDFSVQIFGTDISAGAIQRARAGLYKESIRSDVTPARLRRFFTAVEGGYQINKTIRNMCVFAVQNVFKDPPFSRMDIVSCRNVLIYMSPGLQRRIIPILHYSLKQKGYLMVGNTEGLLGVSADLFDWADRKHKLYRKRPVPSPVQFGFPVEYQEPRVGRPEAVAVPKEAEAFKAPLELQREADRLLLSKYVPAAVLVDEHLDILQTRGHTHRYLELPPGKATLNLLKMARQGIMFDLQATIKNARKNGTARKEAVQVERQHMVNIEVTALKAPVNEAQSFLVIFEDASGRAVPLKKGAKDEQPRKTQKLDLANRQVEQLKRELAATKEYLQSIIEAQEASNEELQSANEEIQSGSEELQSTNEELQTSKEELESANEELSTVNEEMQHRNVQLTQITNDLTNFLASVNIPMVMLGPDLGIRRYTPHAEAILGLTSNDVGRPIAKLKLRIDVPELESQLLSAIQDVMAKQWEIQDQSGVWYQLRIAPYRTADNRIEGAVLTLMDINTLKRTNEDLAIERAKLEEIFRQMPFGLLIAEVPSGKLLRANDRLKHILGHPFSDGTNVADYAPYAQHANGTQYKTEEWPIVRSMNGQVVKDEEMEWKRADGRHIFLSVNSAPVQPKTGNVVGVMAAFFDLTYRRSGEEMLRVSEQMAATGRLAAALAHEINNPLEAITNAVYLLAEDKTLGNEAQKLLQMLNAELKRVTHISHNLLGLYRRSTAPEKFSVEQQLDEVLDFYETRITARKLNVRKQYNIDGELHGFSTEIRQIFLNLIGNAIEALGQNGTLTLRISPSSSRKTPSVKGIRVAIADNGAGIARENWPRVFEPFFTTKEMKGTGLGLWVSRGIANKYGGDIRMRSSTAKGRNGTCFSVFLPSRTLHTGKAFSDEIEIDSGIRQEAREEA